VVVRDCPRQAARENQLSWPDEVMKNDGIHPPFEAFYIESMLWHASSAKHSIDIVNEWLEMVRNNDERAFNIDKSELFVLLQNILHQAGCISRYFFPTRQLPIHQNRAQRLKQALRVADENPLAKRDLRNAIEHFDERLDKYLVESQAGNFISEDVGYVQPESEIPLHIFKGFYTHPPIFVLLGTPYEMAPIMTEMVRINNELLQCSKHGYRLPYLKTIEE
jgi:hypothetical protein